MKTIKRYYSAKTAAYPASTQSNSNSPKGSINNPYTQEEFESFEDGTWPGGWVEGMGYVTAQVNINGSKSSSSDPYSSGSDSSDPWGSNPSDPWASDGSNPNGNNPGGGGGGNTGGTGRPGTSGGTGNSSGGTTTSGNNSVKDVLSPSQFRPYQDNDKSGCFRRCQEMLAFANCKVSDGEIAMTNYDANGRATTPTANVKKGMDYIDGQLRIGHPVIVSVDYKDGTSMGSSRNDQAGDHFVIIVGGSSSNGYHYYDPGKKDVGKGTSKDNMLINKGNRLIDTEIPIGEKGDFYVLTGIRTNK